MWCCFLTAVGGCHALVQGGVGNQRAHVQLLIVLQKERRDDAVADVDLERDVGPFIKKTKQVDWYIM